MVVTMLRILTLTNAPQPAPNRPGKTTPRTLIMASVLSLLAATLLPPPRAWAQVQPGRLQVSPESLLADQLIILTRQVLIAGEDPRPDQFKRARILLDMALELTPDDAESWLLAAELAHRDGDPENALRALARYCKLRPDDDASQLALIMGSIASLQTIDQRIEAAQQVLDSQDAGKLSPALRSRLCSFIAQGMLELNNTQGSLRKLQEALTLDRSNKQAARLIFDWLVGKAAGPDRVGEAMMHMIYADPFDPFIRRGFAELLLSQGAYAAAQQQLQLAQRLTTQPWDDRFYYNLILSQAATGRVEQAIEWLARHESILIAQARAQQTPPPANTNTGNNQQQPPPPSSNPLPPQTGLPMDHELLRLAVLHKTGQPARARGSYNRLKQLLQDRVRAGDTQAQADQAWLGLLFGQEIPSPETLEKIKQDRSEQDPFVIRLVGWNQLRNGDPEEARRTLVTTFDQDPFAAYGVAQSFDRADDPQRIRQLQLVVQTAPNTLAGLLASLDLIESDQQPQPTDHGAKLVKLLNEWPTKLAMLDLREGPWALLHARVEPNKYQYLEPITVRLTLRNNTDFPLSLGPDATIPSQALLYTKVRRDGITLGEFTPLVVDLQRQLRIPASGSVTVEVPLARTDLGDYLTSAPASAIDLDVRVVLTPRFGPDGAVINTAGIIAESDAVYLIERQGWLLSMEIIQMWIDMMHDVDPVRQMRSLAAMMYIAVNMDQSEDGQKAAQQIAAAANRAYIRLTPVGQAWVAKSLPTGEKSAELFPDLHERVQRSDQPTTRLIYTQLNVDNAESPVLNTLLRDPDPRVAAYARALRESLKPPTDEDGENTDPLDGFDE